MFWWIIVWIFFYKNIFKTFFNPVFKKGNPPCKVKKTSPIILWSNILIFFIIAKVSVYDAVDRNLSINETVHTLT